MRAIGLYRRALDQAEALSQGGFYAALVPVLDGGAGIDLVEFVAAVAELGRGCPQSAWCAAALAVGSARARALFDADAGLRAAYAPSGELSARRAGSAWVISGSFARVAGARFATHLLGVARVEGEGGAVRFLAAREQFELSEGGPGSGACAAGVRFGQVAITEAFVSADAAHVDDWGASVPPTALAAVFAGAAARAAEIHAQVVSAAPQARALDPDHQRWLGAAMPRAAAARMLLREAAAANGEGARLGSLARQSMRYAWEAVQDSLGAGAKREPREELERIAGFMLNALSDPAAPSTRPRRSRASSRQAQSRVTLPM